MFKIKRDTAETPDVWLFEEPLFLNSFMSTQTLMSAILWANLSGAGCTKLGHRIKMTATPFDNLRNNSNITFIRLINKVVEEVCGQKKSVHALLNFISGSAKLASWLTHRNQARTVASVEPVSVLRGLLKARLRVEHAYCKMMKTVQVFKHVWAVGEVLCSVREDWELDIHL